MVLAQQRLAHHHVVPFHHIGAHGQSIDRRGLDGRKLAQPGHRHLQRARNRRGGKRQHMHVGAKRLEPLLVCDAETLFFVDNHQSQIAKLGAFRQDCMGADHDIDIAFLQPHTRIGHFLGRHQTREPPHLEREAGKTLGETGVMLARQKGGWSDHSHLLAAHRSDKGGPQRHLGLAETDIATHQPVHRLAAFQIVQHIGNSRILVVGFFPRELLDKLVVGRRFGFEYRRLSQCAQRSDLHQFAGDLADALFQPRTAFLPAFASEPVKHHRVFG